MTQAAEVRWRKPKMIIVDLDFTLWPFRVDKHVTIPLQKGRTAGQLVQADGSVLHVYPEVQDLIIKLHEAGYVLAIASRAYKTRIATTVLSVLGWDAHFKYMEIHSGSKINHFLSLHKKSNIPFEDMLFFDDQIANVEQVQTLGVRCVCVPGGLSRVVVERALTSTNDLQPYIATSDAVLCTGGSEVSETGGVETASGISAQPAASGVMSKAARKNAKRREQRRKAVAAGSVPVKGCLSLQECTTTASQASGSDISHASVTGGAGSGPGHIDSTRKS